MALALAVWRSATSQRDAETAQRTLSHDRYQRAIEMLADQREAVRAAGVYALGQLAKEDPGRYRDEVLRVLEGLFDEERYQSSVSLVELAVRHVETECERLPGST